MAKLTPKKKNILALTMRHQSQYGGGNIPAGGDFPTPSVFWYIRTESGNLIVTESDENALINDKSFSI